MSRKKASSLPTRSELLDYIKAQQAPLTRRELTTAFKIKGALRVPFKILLKELMNEGVISKEGGRYHHHVGDDVATVEVTAVDNDGYLQALPTHWTRASKPPLVTIKPMRGQHAVAVGDRLLVRLYPTSEQHWEATILRVMSTQEHKTKTVVGLFKKVRSEGWLYPSDRRLPDRISVHHDTLNIAESGQLVQATVKDAFTRRLKEARVVKAIGKIEDPDAISDIALHEHNIPVEFSPDALKIAEHAKIPPLGDREDLRGIPLVTIDGEDARDFDDAVWAEKTSDGWHAIVAIADVAYYVPNDSALDEEAYERGNSVYLPNKVVPMLPEALSNGLCSLKPDEDRACLAVHLWIDNNGELKRYKFVRGLMRSHARLTYTQVHKDPECFPTIPALMGVFQDLLKARKVRGTVEIERAERRIMFDDKGWMQDVSVRDRFASHQLIEELMILANVAAATELEKREAVCMYRVHDHPDIARIRNLISLLKSLRLKPGKEEEINQKALSQIVQKAKGSPFDYIVNEFVLKAQSQAVYSPRNIGHYGLNLQRYAHFTSPIRRYSDLIVHRSLIDALNLGDETIQVRDMVDTGEHLSFTERRANLAERDTSDRFMAFFLRDLVGTTFDARITGVQRYGLFVTIEHLSATGLLPKRNLPFDTYVHKEHQHTLQGRRSGKKYTLGDALQVTLDGVHELTGSLEFTIQRVMQKRGKRV